jgi:hypothetical protein
MKKIVKLTERDLTRLVRRVIKEQQEENNDGIVELTEQLILLDGASEKTVSKILNRLPKSIKFLSIVNSEYADFSNIDICSYPRLVMVNLNGTDSNFEEQGYECTEGMGRSMYTIDNFDN